jgi:hypothetical protein
MNVMLLAVLAAIAISTEAKTPCAIEGEPIQWIADYCMLKMETDDEIAVSGCIEEQSKQTFPTACASNAHFKKLMCEGMIHAGTRGGTPEQCIKDPAFKGRTVEAGGVSNRGDRQQISRHT